MSLLVVIDTDYTPIIKLAIKIGFFIIFLRFIFRFTRKFSKQHSIKLLDKVISITIISLVTTTPFKLIYNYISDSINNLITAITSILSKNISDYPLDVPIHPITVVKVLVFYLAFLLVSYIISPLTKSVPSEDIEAKKKKSTLLQNFFTLSGILLSLYLSIVSIVSVPVSYTHLTLPTKA